MTLPELALTSVSDIKVARRRPLTATAFEDTDGVPPPSRSPRRGGGVFLGWWCVLGVVVWGWASTASASASSRGGIVMVLYSVLTIVLNYRCLNRSPLGSHDWSARNDNQQPFVHRLHCGSRRRQSILGSIAIAARQHPHHPTTERKVQNNTLPVPQHTP